MRGGPPLIVVTSHAAARKSLIGAARAHGYSVVPTASGADAFALAMRRRPLGIIADIQLPEGPGRDLLAALRVDYLLREIPFIMVGCADVARRTETADPWGHIMEGLADVLSPPASLYATLQRQASDSTRGLANAVGVGNMLLTMEAAEASGKLALLRGEEHEAVVTFAEGALVGAELRKPNVACGRAALVDIVGYQWREFVFEPADPSDEADPALQGEVTKLVEWARVQNNALLWRMFCEGPGAAEVAIDQAALDAYLHTVPPVYLELLIQIVDDAPAAKLAEKIPKGLLKSMLHEMRSNGVLKATDVACLANLSAKEWSEFVPSHPARGQDPSTHLLRRVLVVLTACFTTVALGIGVYALVSHLLAP